MKYLRFISYLILLGNCFMLFGLIAIWAGVDGVYVSIGFIDSSTEDGANTIFKTIIFTTILSTIVLYICRKNNKKNVSKSS